MLERTQILVREVPLPSDLAWQEPLLRAAEPWVVYNARVDLLEEDRTAPAVEAAYGQLRTHPAVESLIDALGEWPPSNPLKRAYDPKDAVWKLGVLADFGLQRDDPHIAAIGERVFAAQAENGGFLHGGFDHTHSWDSRPYICLSHVMTYALARFGYLTDERLEHAYAQILATQRLDGGWHPNELNLPGRAREAEPSCPFGTENVLRALAVHPAYQSGAAAVQAGQFLLTCWARRAEPYRPVGFGIGTTWDKLQYPFVQYQLLKTLDTLSLVPPLRGDPRYQEMLARLTTKGDLTRGWTAEGVFQPYRDFDFGQKKQPSAWLSFLAARILHRSTVLS
jgi:hypothetical protein